MTLSTDPFQLLRKDDRFRKYTPNSRGNAARITDDQWEPYFPLVRCLHNVRRTRTQILEVLRQHGLEPSVAQLYAKMSKWGLKGYGTATEGDTYSTDVLSYSTLPENISTQFINPSSHIADNDSSGSSSEDSAQSSDTANSKNHDVDTSDTVYDTEGPPPVLDCDDAIILSLPGPTAIETSTSQPQTLAELVKADTRSSTTISTNVSSVGDEVIQRLPSDLMAFVHSTSDLHDFDRHDILNEVASFLCATNSFSDAFVLFDAAQTFLKDNHGSTMALVFATVNCLRSATFKEQCQYAGSLMGEALASLRLLSYTDPYAATAFSSLEEIGRELCVKSELEHLNILYTQIRFSEATFSGHELSRSSTSEYLLQCSDPFQMAKANDHLGVASQSIEVSSITLGRIVGNLSRWCCSALEDFNPISMLPSAGFNPSDQVSVARFTTALSCHFVRKWSFLSFSEILAHCNELLPPNRRDAAVRLCKLAVRVLFTLAIYTMYQATGMTLRSVSGESIRLPESQAQYVSPLAGHLDALARMGSRERVFIFAEMHKTLYNRTLVYRQQMDDHCLTAHVRETGFLLAASFIRLRREFNTDVPRPASNITRAQSPIRDSHSPSRRSKDSSSSMRNLARRNLLVPGMMSKNGSHVRTSWTRRLSTDSNESWNFTKVTGLPAGPTPPESVHDRMLDHSQHNDNNDDNDRQDLNIDLDIDMDMF